MLIRYPQFLEICKYFQDDLQILTFIEKLACGHELSKDYLAHLENDKHEFILMLKQTQVTVSLEKKNTKTIREEMIDNYFSKCIDENKLTVDQSQKLICYFKIKLSQVKILILYKMKYAVLNFKFGEFKIFKILKKFCHNARH